MKNKNSVFYFFALSFFLFSLLCFFLRFSFQLTPPQTFLLQTDFSRLSPDQVNQIMKSDFSLFTDLSLTSSEVTFSFQPASISAKINYPQTGQQLFFQYDSAFSFFSQVKRFFSPQHYSLIVDYDSLSFDIFLAGLSAQVNQAFLPARLELKQGRISFVPGQLGQLLNIAFLRQTLLNRLAQNDSSPLDLPLETLGRLPTEDDISALSQKAQKLIGKSLILTGDLPDIIVDDQTLTSWLDFFSEDNSEMIKQYVHSLSQTVKKDPVNAVFQFEDNKIVEFRPSQNGFSLLEDDLSSSLATYLNRLIATDSASLSFALPLISAPPLVRTQDANNLGIKELLGRGTSTFKHSSAIRNKNIQKGSSVVNHILVPPGSTFSFLEALGDVTLETGYQKAYIIRQGKTELDVGGGICQISTTFFRAMLDSGVDIIERRPHAFRVSYYEEDRPPGYDATVFIPNPDLKFKNDTPAHILIQSTYDGDNKILTYEFYGTSDGRQVEIKNYKQWGWQAPPETRYIDDPTLPPGKLVREETAVPGIKTSFDWLVTRGDEILHQQTFQSNYVPWAAVFRRGV
ncbi:VanW family protein [Patescibacteria group bacterium]|nr:VanW family protein [Patescibacteria group bacterium]